MYVDIVAALNFAVDLFLLLAANRLWGAPNRWKRLLLGAVLGGVYGGCCLMPGFAFLGGKLWRLVFLGLMGLAAFGWSRSALSRMGLFLLLSMALGGMAVGFGRGDVRMILPGAGVIWLLCGLVPGRAAGAGELVPLEITRGGKSVFLLALVDSGNRLRDPISGESVLVIDSRAAWELTGLTPTQLENPLENLAMLPGARLIPYRSVGHSGFLLAMRFPDMRIAGRKCSRVVAFAPRSIGTEEGYRALTGGATG